MKGATIAATTFTWYEQRLVRLIDKRKKEKQEFVIESTETLKFTTCSIITRKRIRKHKRR